VRGKTFKYRGGICVPGAANKMFIIANDPDVRNNHVPFLSHELTVKVKYSKDLDISVNTHYIGRQIYYITYRRDAVGDERYQEVYFSLLE
jgi:hypothetical protein